MKRAAFLLALMLLGAFPAAAQSNEFGLLVGGSRRFISGGEQNANGTLIDDGFSFSDTAVDLFWAGQLEPDTYLKIKAGRIDTPVAFADENGRRTDAKGELQHLDALIEYRFDEPYGSTGLFGGIGLYRQSASGFETQNHYGFTAGVSADFPMTPRYGIATEAAYHWARGDFGPRYLTVSAGLRISY